MDRNLNLRDRPTWKEDKTGKDVVVTFGNARERVWNSAKAEIEAYRSGISEKTGKRFEEVDPFNDVMNAYLGKSSSLMQLMENALGLSYKKAAHFLGTYCVQKIYGLSVTELYDKEDGNRMEQEAWH